MPLAVSDIGDEVKVFTFLAPKQSVNGLDYHLDDVDVLPLVESADVIGLRHLSVMEYHVDGSCMVFHIQPVSHILTFSIYRQWLAMPNVIEDDPRILQDWDPYVGDRMIRLCIIGKNLDKKHIAAELDKLLADN